MRFLVIASFADSLLRFRGALLHALQDAGAEVHVAAPDLPPGDPLRLQLEAQGFQVHAVSLRRTGTNPVADVRTLYSLLRLMRKIKPDAVLGYTIKPVIYGMLAAWLAGVPRRYALITGLGYAFSRSGSRLNRLVMRLYAFSLQRARKVFFQNPDDEQLFRQKRILDAATPSVVVNGSGVDLAAFPMTPLPAGAGVRFLLIARLLGDKGVREYAVAAAAIRQRHPAVTCDLVGWLDSNPDAIGQQELDDWIAAGTIRFLGRLDDVRPAIAACSVYVLPSYREGTPRTVLEAMAMGRAVITTDAPGCRETVLDGDNGFLIPVQSAAALETAMLQLIETDGLMARMGSRSRELAEQKYDVHKVNALMLQEMDVP